MIRKLKVNGIFGLRHKFSVIERLTYIEIINFVISHIEALFNLISTRMRAPLKIENVIRSIALTKFD